MASGHWLRAHMVMYSSLLKVGITGRPPILRFNAPLVASTESRNVSASMRLRFMRHK